MRRATETMSVGRAPGEIAGVRREKSGEVRKGGKEEGGNIIQGVVVEEVS